MQMAIAVPASTCIRCDSKRRSAINFNPNRRQVHRSIPIGFKTRKHEISNRRNGVKIISAMDEVSSYASPAQVEITWQIIVGALAGVVPFVVAGIEFSKRIISQKRCEVCSGSGLVLEDNKYYRCPGCGGFLPWQSWRRFFSG